MNLLFLDLQSNGLLEEGNGDQLKQTGNLLLTVARKDVPGVADKLRQAQANINEALPHIKGAEEEIGKVISDLDKVIEGAKSILVDDRLLRELTEIIKQEELLKKGSIDWIRKMQVNPDSKNLDRGRLSRVQESVIDQYAEFYDLLIQSKETSKGTAAGERFEATEKSLTASDPEALMSSAVDNILKDQALAAGTDQGKAIEALRAAQKILSAEEDGFDDLINAIQHLISIQRELKDDTQPPVADANAPKPNLFNDKRSERRPDRSASQMKSQMSEQPISRITNQRKSLKVHPRRLNCDLRGKKISSKLQKMILLQTVILQTMIRSHQSSRAIYPLA